MEIKELIEKQEKTGHIFLVRQGLFLRGYNSGARMLEHLLGYKVTRISLKSYGGEVCVAGFPSDRADRVIEAIRKQGGEIVEKTDCQLEIGGLNYTCTPEEIAYYEIKEKKGHKVKEPVNIVHQEEKILARKVLGFNLSAATPLEAMLFLHEIQKEFKELNK
ncbi:MAG: hypothetical protein LUG98_03620 [Tannerellaceae bacterium]|nr:hypothetical protein [Tannerellaceae bacterium]